MDNIQILILVIGISLIIFGVIIFFRAILGLFRKRFSPFYYINTPLRYINYKNIYEIDNSEKGFIPSKWINELKGKETLTNYKIKNVKCSKNFYYYLIFKDLVIGIVFLVIGFFLIFKTF